MAASRFGPSILLDTSAILAILDKNDLWHGPCSEVFPKLDLPLLTSEAVLTELFHLAERSRVEMESAWDFIHSGSISLGVIQNDDLPAIHRLMTRYADRPMDFADATLVHLANREHVLRVFTIDRADFATYRIGAKRRFDVLPASRN